MVAHFAPRIIATQRPPGLGVIHKTQARSLLTLVHNFVLKTLKHDIWTESHFSTLNRLDFGTSPHCWATFFGNPAEMSSKRVRPEDDSDDSEEEHSVPLKRRQYLQLIPPTKEGGTLGESLRHFSVLSNPFRHHYSELPDGYIRILTIKKRKTNDPSEPLELELHLEALDSPTRSYEALSYEWGSSFPRHSVTVRDFTTSIQKQFEQCRESQEDARVRARDKFRLLTRLGCYKRSHTHDIKLWSPKRLVRENLYNALLQFRHSRKDVRFWIDAICINQHNPVEKTKQIAQMAEIYNGARHVRIWLGVKGDDTDVAMDFIKKLADFETLTATLAENDIGKKWVALTNLMRSRWFSRRWVLQEQGVARKSTIYYGAKMVDWTDFADAVSIFRTKRDSILKVLDDPPLGNTAVIEVFDGLGATKMVRQNTHVLRKDLQGKLLERTSTLEELVCEFTPFRASDPRDTIYAVMSIARHQGADFETIKPNYKKSLLEVYIDFVRFCVHSSKSLDILCRHWAPVETTLRALAPELNAAGNQVKNYVEIETTLPSWIKQLDGSKYGTPENILRGRKHGDVFATLKPLYNASRGALRDDIKYEFGTRISPPTDSQDLMEIDLKETWNGELTVRGIVLGKVRRVSQRILEGTIPREVFEMGGWQHSRRPDDHTVHEMPDQLWRTLVANQGFDGQPPTYFRRSCLYALQRESTSGDVNIKSLMDHDLTPEVVSVYLRKVQDVTRNRKAFLAGKKRELFGFGPEGMKSGERDYICILYGCSVPVVLRQVRGTPPKIGKRKSVPSTLQSKRADSYDFLPGFSDSSPEPTDEPSDTEPREYWRLIGECYVDGRMEGEALDSQEYLTTVRDFVLI